MIFKANHKVIITGIVIVIAVISIHQYFDNTGAPEATISPEDEINNSKNEKSTINDKGVIYTTGLIKTKKDIDSSISEQIVIDDVGVIHTTGLVKSKNETISGVSAINSTYTVTVDVAGILYDIDTKHEVYDEIKEGISVALFIRDGIAYFP